MLLQDFHPLALHREGAGGPGEIEENGVIPPKGTARP
jgi:hypothetical protein